MKKSDTIDRILVLIGGLIELVQDEEKENLIAYLKMTEEEKKKADKKVKKEKNLNSWRAKINEYPYLLDQEFVDLLVDHKNELGSKISGSDRAFEYRIKELHKFPIEKAKQLIERAISCGWKGIVFNSDLEDIDLVKTVVPFEGKTISEQIREEKMQND